MRQVAEQGDVEAQYKIGLYYENKTPKNYPEAINGIVEQPKRDMPMLSIT